MGPPMTAAHRSGLVGLIVGAALSTAVHVLGLSAMVGLAGIAALPAAIAWGHIDGHRRRHEFDAVRDREAIRRALEHPHG